MGCGGSILILQGMSTKLREFQCLKSDEMGEHINSITYLPINEISSPQHLQDEESSSFTFLECNLDTLMDLIEDVGVVGNIDDGKKGESLDSGKSNHLCVDKDGFSKERVEMKIDGKIKEKKEMEDEEEGGDLFMNELYPDPPSFTMYCLDSLIEDSSDEEKEVKHDDDDDDDDRHNHIYNQSNKRGKVSNRESIHSNEVSIKKLSKTWKRARRIKKIFNVKRGKRKEH